MRKYLRDVRESQKDKTDCYSSPAVRYGENKTKWIEVKQDTSKLQKSRIALFTDNLGLVCEEKLFRITFRLLYLVFIVFNRNYYCAYLEIRSMKLS
jgi:hypothetical protein